jgi:predicted ATPase
VRRIRQLVDGMPLGIELAAAWVHSLAPIEIADELARDVDLLSFAQLIVVK